MPTDRQTSKQTAKRRDVSDVFVSFKLRPERWNLSFLVIGAKVYHVVPKPSRATIMSHRVSSSSSRHYAPASFSTWTESGCWCCWCCIRQRLITFFASFSIPVPVPILIVLVSSVLFKSAAAQSRNCEMCVSGAVCGVRSHGMAMLKC